jgi:hypothetical protein
VITTIAIFVAASGQILMAANTLSRSEQPVAVTQRSSARYRHWPFRCCLIQKKYKRFKGKKKACVLAGDHRSVSPDVRALEMGSFDPGCLVTRMTRAV